ncbi:hypothetical protein EniLVp02_0237 [Vibrio phage EniLVp02]
MDIPYNDNVTKIAKLLNNDMLKESLFESAQRMIDLAHASTPGGFAFPNGATKSMAVTQTNEAADAVVFVGEIYRRVVNFIVNTMGESFGRAGVMEVVSQCIDKLDVKHFAGHEIDSPRNALLFSMIDTAIVAKFSVIKYTFQDFPPLATNNVTIDIVGRELGKVFDQVGDLTERVDVYVTASQNAFQ